MMSPDDWGESIDPERMNEKPYRITDNGTLRGVHVYDPEGIEITDNVFEYEIIRSVSRPARVRLGVFLKQDGRTLIVADEPVKTSLYGAIVCEITQAKGAANGCQ